MILKRNNDNITPTDLEYMSSLSVATLVNSASSSRFVLWVSFSLCFTFIIWASFTEVDEITQGEGKVIPASHLQVVQNLEGGIVHNIFVKEGDKVKKGQLILQLSDVKHSSDYSDTKIKFEDLQARKIRLEAEANGANLSLPSTLPFASQEQNYYEINRQNLINKIRILNEQLNQKINELNEARSKSVLLQKSYELIKKEESISKNMVNSGVQGGVDYLKIQREANTINKDLNEARQSVPRLEYAITEIKDKMVQEKLDFQTKSREELNKVVAEYDRAKAGLAPLADQVERTKIIAPVDGTVKQLFINTVGGVIKPGMDIVEIVPNDEILLMEAKIKPADIAFIHLGQKSVVKFTAYDYSIYGGLEGTVTNISADTIVDQKNQESYYLVTIKTNKNFIGKNKKHFEIIPGMVVNVNIVTGKKTIIEYLLKPIFKAREVGLTER